jgi:tetratricopeptide (TPR) repeat protein
MKPACLKNANLPVNIAMQVPSNQTKKHQLGRDIRVQLFLLAMTFTCSVFGQSAKKFYKTGEDFLDAGKFQDAINQFSSAISLNPEYKEAYMMRGITFENINEFQKAADDFNRAIIFDPKNEELCFHLGKSYYELKQYKDALNILNKATFLNRKFLPAYQEKILVMLAMDQTLNALKVSDSTLALDGNALNYYLHGQVTEKMNSSQKAEWAYAKAIKEDKKYVDAYLALANLQLSLNKSDEAMNNCNEALKINPNGRQALLVRSKVFLKKIDYRNAVDDVSRVISLNQNDEDAFFIRGGYYQQFSQHQNAINDFNKVLSINPKNAEAYYKRANSYEEIANFQAAIKDYEALVKISEYDAKAQKLLKQAQDRLFELMRENDNPQIVLVDPLPKDKFIIEVPSSKQNILIKGYITDKSDISYIKVNNANVTFKKLDGKYEFITEVPVDSLGLLTIAASDVYKNVEKLNFSLKRTEINPPKVSIIAPLASDNGEIYLDNNDASLYIEGKITDESPIKSIIIDGVSGSFKVDEMNPTFSASININNKNKFTVTATDIYGNEKPYTFTINREGAALLGNNPMGKTWVIFLENSNYHTFASLEGPTKDVSLMRAALAKYQINNIIHKKDMTKEQMEKFFSIDLRDLVRSNRVNTLLVWYAGHGKFINETGYWIPVDANRDDEFTYFNINFLKASMQSYASQLTHTLVVTDACESGPTFFQAMRAALKERSCDDWQATRLKSSQVFSSAGYELAQDNSQFTKTFATLLAGNPNSCIPIESIVIKITSATSQQTKQKPKFGKIAGLPDEEGTFFFISKDK